MHGPLHRRGFGRAGGFLPVRAGLALAMALSALGLVLAATPAQAAIIDCTPMGDPACRDLTPIVECAWDNGNGTRDVVFGYNNPSTSTLHIEPGSHNRLSPGADFQGQPLDFVPGRVRNVVVITVTGTSATWRLGNTRADLAVPGTPSCATKPVPQVGSVLALGLGVFALLLTALAVVAARRRRPREVVR